MDEQRAQLAKEVEALIAQRMQEGSKLSAILNETNAVKLVQEEVVRTLARDTAQRDTLAAEVAVLVENRNDLDRTLDTLKARKGALAGEITAHERHLEELARAQAAFSEQARTEITARITAEVNASLKDARDRVQALHEEGDALAATVETLTKKVGTLGATIDHGQHQVQALTAHITERRGILADLEAMIDGKTRQAEALSAQIGSLEGNSAELRAEIAALTTERNTLNDTIGARRQELARLEAETAAARERYATEQAKLFGIAERELKLDQREAFIKEKYQAAGVTYH